MEIWKDIPSYEGLYQVSNSGNIKSLPRIWICGRGRKNSHGIILLKLFPNKKGYPSTYLSKDGKTKTYRVNRIVAQAFIPNPENKPEVNHNEKRIRHVKTG